MANTLAQGIAWVHAHPTRRNVPGAVARANYGWSWSQLCVALVYWALGATHTSTSAKAAYYSSRPVAHTENVPLPAGAIAWFAVGADWHVGFGIGGNQLISATSHASSIGPALGVLTPQQYVSLAPGAKYLGYSWDFCGQSFAGTSTAGVGPVTPITQGDEDMIVIRNVDGEIGVFGETTYTPFTAAQYGALGTLFPPFVQVTQAQHDAVLAFVAANRAKLPAGGAAIDTAPLVAAVTAAVRAAIAAGNADDDVAIAKAVDAVLADNFAAIPGQVRAKIIAPSS